jgi:predicted transcriptional regulator
MTTKTTVELNEDLTSILDELSKKQGTSKAQIVRRSIALLKYLDEAQSIKVVDREGKEKEVVIP